MEDTIQDGRRIFGKAAALRVRLLERGVIIENEIA